MFHQSNNHAELPPFQPVTPPPLPQARLIIPVSDIWLAVKRGDLAFIRRYVNAANVNNIIGSIPGDNLRQNYSLLHLAVEHDQLAIAQYLIEINALIDARTTDLNTPLLIACYFRREAISALLLNHHARVNIRNKFFSTPFSVLLLKPINGVNDDEALAVRMGRLLIQYNADTNPDMKISSQIDASNSITYCTLSESAFKNDRPLLLELIEEAARRDSNAAKAQMNLVTEELLGLRIELREVAHQLRKNKSALQNLADDNRPGLFQPRQSGQ